MKKTFEYCRVFACAFHFTSHSLFESIFIIILFLVYPHLSFHSRKIIFRPFSLLSLSPSQCAFCHVRKCSTHFLWFFPSSIFWFCSEACCRTAIHCNPDFQEVCSPGPTLSSSSLMPILSLFQKFFFLSFFFLYEELFRMVFPDSVLIYIVNERTKPVLRCQHLFIYYLIQLVSLFTLRFLFFIFCFILRLNFFFLLTSCIS